MIKIYAAFALVIAALLGYLLVLKAQNKALQSELTLSVNANKELNATLSKVIERNELEKAVLEQKHKEDLQNLAKTKEALNYVKNSRETNTTRLFNDTLKLLR